MENHGNCISDYELAMAYVPVQENIDTYELDEGFENGTIFPVLNKPFMAGERK